MSHRRRNRLIALGVVVALAAVVGLGWWLTHSSAPRQGGFGGFPGGGGGGGGFRFPATTVGIAPAAVGDMPVMLEALGTVQATATVTIRPQVSGTITKVLFTEGQMVNAGDVLVTIDPRPYEAARMQAEGNLQRDQAQLESARLTLKRYQTLLGQDSIAGQEVDTQAATVQQLEGTVISDKAAVATARLNLDFTRIVSPVRGRTGLRVVDAGNYIASGDASGVVVVTVVDPIDVEFTLPQDQVPAVHRRMAEAKDVKLPVTALDRTRANVLAEGVFSTLDNQVNTSTGTVRAKARFDNKDGELFPNQFVNVRLLLDTQKGAVLVPAAAVRSGANGSFVYLLNRANNTVSMRAVKLGATGGDKVAILEGVKAGEEVITEGGDRLSDGASVQLPGAPGAGGGGFRPGAGANGQRPQRPGAGAGNGAGNAQRPSNGTGAQQPRP